ncbi:metal-dependent hydrolase [Paenibacillus sp. HWE-109]|uniref:metal-dependent hydrolase n=1 Tax=Paenibacillus sp. HWE-109 TaxID=1306526 RepID=UPI001EDD6704|nr:metal-dependent hydrolase [Paenibacillus sp. HWE-109]UKS25342.1 metal-dependent hydrolase [Paenibacillus sp. HWE-109]
MYVLISHVLTHAVLGSILAYLLNNGFQNKRMQNFPMLIYGAMIAISPDFFKYFLSSLISLSHSILFSLFLGLGFAMITRKKTFSKQFGIAVAIIWGAHLVPDSLEHGVPFFYPFFDAEISFDVLLLGDPWFLVPLVISLGTMFFQPTQKRVVSVFLTFAIVYLGVREVDKQIFLYQIKNQFNLTPEASIEVIPTAENLIRPLFPLDWFEWKYSVYSEQRIIIGQAFLLGRFPLPQLNAIYLSKNPLIRNDSFTYRSTQKEERQYKVLVEKEFQGKHYIAAMHQDKRTIFVFSPTDNTWYEMDKMDGDFLQQLITK